MGKKVVIKKKKAVKVASDGVRLAPFPTDVTPLIPPSGVKGGIVLPRTDKPFEACPPLMSAPGFDVIPQSEWQQWIESGVNTSFYVWYVSNQKNVGSCASESGCNGLAAIREAAGLPRVEFNPYGVYGRVNGGSDSGSTLSANLKFLRDYGAFPEAVWPRSKGWRENPSAAAYAEAKKYRIHEFYEVSSWLELGSALLRGWLIYWGYSGHAILGVDLLSDSKFRYLNSWGQWGSASPYSSVPYGFGIANASSILWAYGVYAFRTPIVEV